MVQSENTAAVSQHDDHSPTSPVKSEHDSFANSEFTVQYDPAKIRNFIGKISQINKKQVENAFKETQRNRKISSIGTVHNMTIG